MEAHGGIFELLIQHFSKYNMSKKLTGQTNFLQYDISSFFCTKFAAHNILKESKGRSWGKPFLKLNVCFCGRLAAYYIIKESKGSSWEYLS
jgi:hypothetical protein